MAEHIQQCEASREWLSAHRDGEAVDEPNLRRHVATCPGCTAWAQAVDDLVPRSRMSAADAGPDPLGPARQRFAAVASHSPLWRTGRAAVALAGVLAAVVAGVGLAGAADVALAPVATTGGLHELMDRHVLELALAAGFLLAAARPERYGHAMGPVAAVAALLTFLVVPTAALPTTGSALAEAGHLALLLGAAGCYLLWQADRESA
jgi:predicted anti-sigma-YlaC factor YlaD